MGVSRPSRAIDLVKKWDCKIQQNQNSTDNEESSRDVLIRQESGLELLSFSDESRNRSDSNDEELDDDEEEAMKQQWYVKNS